MYDNEYEKKKQKIRDIEVVTSVKYLGMRITEKRAYMAEHKGRKIETARKMAGMTFSVTARSCNKLLIGKSYWKSVVLPSVLMGGAVIIWKKEIEKNTKG